MMEAKTASEWLEDNPHVVDPDYVNLTVHVSPQMDEYAEYYHQHKLSEIRDKLPSEIPYAQNDYEQGLNRMLDQVNELLK